MFSLKRLIWKFWIMWKIIKNRFKYGDVIVFQHYKHQKLWLWLHHHPDKYKHNWPGWVNYEQRVRVYCFACEYASAMQENDHNTYITCHYCPFKIMNNNFTDSIPLESIGTHCLKGLFMAWENSVGNDAVRRKLALDIAMLEVKDNVLTDYMVYYKEDK